jgi:hypothetical protein
VDPAILQSLAHDTRNYQAFKQRVEGLPPSPPPRQQAQ